jgi:hypothetical protein
MPDGTPAPARMRRTAVGLVVMTGLSVTACSQAVNPVGNGATSTPSATSTASTSGQSTTSGPIAPLTGLPASAAAAAQPAVVVAVSGPDPQGLGSADVVYEEIASPVRYLAVYQSRSATDVGPVTTTQYTDRYALSVLHPLFAYNGAAAGYIVAELDKTKIIDAGYAKYSSLYTTGSQGLAVTSTQAIPQAVHGGTAPPPLFTYRNTGAAGDSLASSGVTRPTTVSVSIPGAGTQNWTFDQQADRWTQTSGGPDVQVANLVIESVKYEQININARDGISVTAAEVTGSGKAQVFSGSVAGGSGGTAASGTWSMPHDGLLTNYLDAQGTPMAFQPGPTWVIYAPPGTDVTAGSS